MTKFEQSQALLPTGLQFTLRRSSRSARRVRRVGPDNTLPHVIALVGMPAAGKSTVAQILRDRLGSNWIRSREIVAALSTDRSSADFQQGGLDVFAGEAANRFCEELFSHIKPGVVNVIDAVRPMNHWIQIRNRYGDRANLVGVQAPADIREERMVARDGQGLFLEREHHVVGCSSDTDTLMYRPLWEKHDVFRDLDGTFVGVG
ncbi:MAG: AAA family ATPase [Gammaproteobacteria bacterium]